MNVLLSSTLGWNPGDDFIRFGCETLITAAAHRKDKAVNYFLYNRNPDLMVGPRYPSTLKTDTVGDYVQNRVPECIDLVVACGSPEWATDAHEELHKAIIEKDLPYVMLGIGTVANTIRLSALDIAVMSRSNTHIVCRSAETAKFINETLGMEKAEAQVCPALFCILVEWEKSIDVLQIPQVPYPIGGQSVKREYLEGLDKNIPILAETWREAEHYTQAGFNVKLYNYCAWTNMTSIGRAKKVVTTRLHAAVAGLAQGSEVVIVGAGDYRIETAAKMFGIPVVKNFKEGLTTPGLQDYDKWKAYYYYLNFLERIL